MSGPMKKAAATLVATVLLAFGAIAEAQQAAKVPQIGFLTTSGRATSIASVDAFRQGLRELGYVEGKNINIEYRYAEGRFERLPELAKELVRLKVDIFLVPSVAVARPATKVTATIPIVVVNAGDPIASGLVASQARPGGSVTGLTTYSPELLGKRLELLNEVIPKVSRFAFLIDANATANRTFFTDAQLAAKALGVNFQVVALKAPNPDVEGAIRLIVKEGIGARVTEATQLITFYRRRILELVEQNRIAAIHSEQEWANAGGLMSYGANRVDSYRRAAIYVDKI